MVGDDFQAESKEQLRRQTLKNKDRLSLIEEELDGVTANRDIFKAKKDILDLNRGIDLIERLNVNQQNKIKELFSRNYKAQDGVEKLTKRVEDLEKQLANMNNPQNSNGGN